MSKTVKEPLAKKYLIIGLDGATPEILETMVKKGDLPNIKGLMEKGAYGRIRSTLPPLSPVAWTTMSTGVGPAKHGIIGFERRVENSYMTEVCNSTLRKIKPIWVLLSEMGKRVGVINVPMTFPPDNVNGVMISGLGTPGEMSNFTFPTHLKDELVRDIGDLGIFETKSKPKEKGEYIKNINDAIENQFNTALYCMTKYDYDFFMLVFTSLDRASHFLWSLRDEEHPLYKADEVKRYGDVIQKCYRLLDDKIATLIKKFDDKATILIVSDHGFGPLHKAVSMNILLERLGLLNFCHSLTSRAFKRKQFIMKLKGYMNRKKKHLLKFFKKSGFQTPGTGKGVLSNFQFFESIDWGATLAYSTDDCGSIFINLKGREPQGIVEDGLQLQELKEKIKKELLLLKDPENGKNMIKEVIFKEDIYTGECLDKVPDILLIWEYGYSGVTERARIKRGLTSAKGNFWVQHNWSGFHTMNGIFILSGPSTKPQAIIKDISLKDVFPTILYSMGLSIPNGLDGRIIKECFIKEIEAQFSSNMQISTNSADKNVLTDEEKEKIEERLKSLGYLE